MTDLSDFKDLYLQTAKENITLIKSGLISLSLEQAYRNAHTLKTKSIMMGHARIGEMAKAIEDTLNELKEEKISISPETLATLQTIAGQIEEEIQNI